MVLFLSLMQKVPNLVPLTDFRSICSGHGDRKNEWKIYSPMKKERKKMYTFNVYASYFGRNSFLISGILIAVKTYERSRGFLFYSQNSKEPNASQ